MGIEIMYWIAKVYLTIVIVAMCTSWLFSSSGTAVSYHSWLSMVKYCVVGSFDGENFDIFNSFQLDHQNLTYRNFYP